MRFSLRIFRIVQSISYCDKYGKHTVAILAVVIIAERQREAFIYLLSPRFNAS